MTGLAQVKEERMITNPVYHELVRLKIINSDTLKRISDCTRDQEIPVYLDTTSRVIFLGRYETSEQYYESQKRPDREEDKAIVHFMNGSMVKTRALDNHLRRYQQFKHLIADKRLCDFGCGHGYFLDLAKQVTDQLSGVELRESCRKHLQTKEPTFDIRRSLDAFEDRFDVVTLFHVLEHLPHQSLVLRQIRERLNSNGVIIVEVPHARDFLMQWVDLPEFRAFTFWSEHLILHTEPSLRCVLQNAGFTDIQIYGYQRYGYTNHLKWFLDRKPGGHESLKEFENESMEEAYREYLERIGATDTLIATARIHAIGPRNDEVDTQDQFIGFCRE